jgi:Skp family chaperone for outer membrane proteins
MRAMLWMGSGVVALAVVVGAGRLWAESEEKPAKPAPRTRVALLNLTYVIKNYDKYKHFQEELRKVVKPSQQKMEELHAREEKLRKEMRQADLSQTKKENIESKVKSLQRRLEDIYAEGKVVVAKKSDVAMKTLYLDVVHAAQAYTKAHDFDLLLHYNDATSEEEMNCVQNITRKLNTGGLTPVYAVPGIDISKGVTDLLNQDKGAAQ